MYINKLIKYEKTILIEASISIVITEVIEKDFSMHI